MIFAAAIPDVDAVAAVAVEDDVPAAAAVVRALDFLDMASVYPAMLRIRLRI